MLPLRACSEVKAAMRHDVPPARGEVTDGGILTQIAAKWQRRNCFELALARGSNLDVISHLL